MLPTDFQFAPVTSTFVPLPLDEVARTGQVLQGQYDENLFKYDQLKQLMDSIQATPRDKSALQEELLRYQNDLESLASSTNWIDAAPGLRRTTHNFSKNYQSGNIATIRNNYATYLKHQEDQQKLGEKLFLHDDGGLGSYLKTPVRDESGNITRFNYRGLQEQLDWNKFARDSMSNINDSGYIGKMFDMNTANILRTKEEGWEGVAEKVVRSLAGVKAREAYQNPSKELIQFIRASGASTPEGALQALYGLFYSEGANQIGVKTTNKQDVDVNWKGFNDQAAAGRIVLPTTEVLPGEGGDPEAAANLPEVEPLQLWDAEQQKNVTVFYDKDSDFASKAASMDNSDVAAYTRQLQKMSNQEATAEFADFERAMELARPKGSLSRAQTPESYKKLVEQYQSYRKLRAGKQHHSILEHVDEEVAKSVLQQVTPDGNLRAALIRHPFVYKGKLVNDYEELGKGWNKPLYDVLEAWVGSVSPEDLSTQMLGFEYTPVGGMGIGYRIRVTNKKTGKSDEVTLQAPREITEAADESGLTEVLQRAQRARPVEDIPLGKGPDGKVRALRLLTLPASGGNGLMQKLQELENGEVVRESPIDQAVRKLIHGSKAMRRYYNLGTAGRVTSTGTQVGGDPSDY